MLDDNKAVARRLHMEIIQEFNLDLADDIIAPHFVVHVPGFDPARDLRGPEAAEKMARDDHEVFPTGMQFEHYDTLAEGELVAFRWILRGDLKTGEHVEVNGIDILRITNGKIAEAWVPYYPTGP